MAENESHYDHVYVTLGKMSLPSFFFKVGKNLSKMYN